MALTYLPSSTLDTLKNVSFVAKSLVDGALLGLHRSPWHGFSSEFAEYRKYVPGDNVRHIDWKTYARSDRYYIKCYEEETNLRCFVLLDTSASMGMSSDDSSMRKFHYACYLSAAFLYLSYKQRDASTLGTWSNEAAPMERCASSLDALNRHLASLETLTPSGISNGACLARIAECIPQRSLVILFSDFLDNGEGLFDALRQLAFKNCEIILFQILNNDEIDFPYRGLVRFKDLETGEVLELESSTVRQRYLTGLHRHNATLRDFCDTNRIILETLTTDTPFEKALTAYFSKRERLN